MFSNFKDIIARLEAQKAAIDQAISTLREFDDADEAPTKTAAAKRGPLKKVQKKRTMSPEARKAISDAAKKRWAAVRKSAKKAA